MHSPLMRKMAVYLVDEQNLKKKLFCILGMLTKMERVFYFLISDDCACSLLDPST